MTVTTMTATTAATTGRRSTERPFGDRTRIAAGLRARRLFLGRLLVEDLETLLDGVAEAHGREGRLLGLPGRDLEDSVGGHADRQKEPAELVERQTGTLGEHVRRRGGSHPQRLRQVLVRDVADGLYHLHQVGEDHELVIGTPRLDPLRGRRAPEKTHPAATLPPIASSLRRDDFMLKIV